MKKLLFLLILTSGLFATEMAAQPSFTTFPEGNIVAEDGDQVCIPIRTADFTQLLKVSFSVTWDPTVLQYSSIQNINSDLMNLSMVDFDVSASLTNNGELNFDWDSDDDIGCTTNPPFPPFDDLEDDAILFEICFNVTGIYGGYSEIKITDRPLVDVVNRMSAGCLDIGTQLQTTCTSVSIGYTPVTFNCGSASGPEGETVCVPITVDDFNDISSFQYTVEFDPTMVQFATFESFNISPNIQFNANNAGDGFITVSWFEPNNNFITLPDGTTIIEICFVLLGECGNVSPFTITSDPTPIEVVDGTSQDINPMDPHLQPRINSGEISIECFNPNGITLNMDDQEVCIGEEFCIDVTVEDFFEIRRLDFSLNWNSNVLQFEDIININSNFPSNVTFPGSNFNDDQTNSGKLGFEWMSSSVLTTETIPDGQTLFSICFRVVGSGGSSSVVSFTNDPTPIFVSNKDSHPDDIGLNTNSSLVNVKPTQGITVIAGNNSGFPGDEVCIDFEVADFDDITRVQFSMNWNGNGEILEFSQVILGDLPDLEQFNFQDQFTNSGSLGFEWESFGDPVSVPNGTVIFSVCFNIIGDPGECSPITIDDVPFEVDVQNSMSNGINIGLNGQPGEICVENPSEYIVTLSDNFGAPGSETCIQVSVENFNQMTQNNYSIVWNPEDLEFVSVNPTGDLPSFDGDSYDDSIDFTEDGELVINWDADNQIQGESVPDGTVIYEICFIILGEPGSCTGVSISDEPEPIVVTTAPTGSSNLGLTPINGSVCVTDVLSISNINITGVDCPGEDSGEISFNVMGGSGMYDFMWEGPGINAGNVNSPVPLQNVSDGTYGVTITDSGGISFDTTFTIGVSNNAPIADAGEDFTPDCDQDEIFLDGTGSTGNGPLEYEWTGINSNCTAGIMPGTQNSPTPQVLGNCTYILTITETTTNCSVSDTVTVFAQTTAVPDAGPDLEATCLMDTVTIEAEYLQNGNVMAEWTAISGTIYESTDTTATVSAGEYVIALIANSGTGCVGTDTVVVVDNMMPPTADAGMEGVLGCSDVSVQLDASASTSATGGGLEYFWSATDNGNGDVCSGDAMMPQIDACGVGEYEVIVTDSGNGCTATDLVLVMGDTLKPISDAGLDMILTCENEGIVVLDGSGSSMGSEFEYSWIFNGAEVGDDLQYEVNNEPGTYTFMVTNTDNMCSAESVVIVTDDMDAPLVTASAAVGFFSCNNMVDTITAFGGIPNATFEWSAPITSTDSVVIIELDQSTFFYAVTVTNTENGCTGVAEVTIGDQTNPPIITAGPDKFFNCMDGEVLLEGEIDPDIPGAVIQWSTDGAGCFVTSSTDLQPIVDCEGMYVLTVQDPENGCISRDTVMVSADMSMPEITDITTDTITCLDMCGDLSFNLTDPSMIPDVTIQWSLNSDPIMGETGTTLEACEPGIYEILVTHNISGCTDAGTVTVQDFLDEPTADAGADSAVDCDNPMTTLDGSTSLIAGETTIQWCDEDGNPIADVDEAIVEVGGGIYTLKVTNISSGCTATDEVTITSDGDLPTADAGPDVEKGCNDATVTLDGSGSDTGDYQWTDENGEPLVNGTNNTVEVELAGTYTLTVTDPNTGCSASDNVVVTFNINLPDADAMADADECSTEGMLIGNLPMDATGVWTALNSGVIADPLNDATTVTDLTAGENCFVWTLSSGTCVDYSTDTVCVNTASVNLNAVNDGAITQDSFSVATNVLDNDEIGNGNITFTVLTTPTIGTIDSTNADGSIYYTPNIGFEGDVLIDYEICSLDCPGLCDTATLEITVTLEPTEPGMVDVKVPNGITPNGDGVNDALVFDILETNPDDFPRNEIIIFNRWGDIIFNAQPYQNDWNGVNMSDEDLPEATYYYILRLDVGDSEILRGDVTIVR